MSGQEGDTRKFRRLKHTDYYEAKSALEKKEKTKWDKCVICGQEIKGQNFSGYCFRCHNEPG